MTDDDALTPGRVIRETWRWWPAALTVGVAAILLLACLSLFVWHVDGVFQAKSIQRGYSSTVNSQGYQDGLIGEMQQELSQITGPGGLAAARASLDPANPEQETIRASELTQLSMFCSQGAQLSFTVPGAQALQGTYDQNCEAGTVIASPPLAPPAS